MPNRILISSSDSGPANFTFGINPSFYDPVDDAYVAEIDMLFAPSVHQRRGFDGRLRTLIWSGYKMDNVNMSAIVEYLRSIEGEIRYFNFQDIDDLNDRWPSSDTWKKTRVIRIKIQYKSGGQLKYEKIELKIQPEQ